jgi:proteasome accessory factor C
MMAYLFSRPARLSPLMVRALLLAFDLLGEAIAMDDTESLATVRDKIRSLAGSIPGEGGVVVDDVMPASPALLEVLNHALREHTVVEIEYFTPTRGRLARRRVEPYLLFRSRDGWYLEAYCLNAQAQRTFRLEYIRSATATTHSFAPRPEVDLEARRSGSPFASGGSVDWAVVRFAPRRRPYLDDRAIAFQTLSDGTVRGRMPYLDRRWLTKEIVRFLGEAVLEQPVPIREEIRASASALKRLYVESAPDQQETGR